MDLQGTTRSGNLNYFVTLTSQGPKGLFDRHPSIKEMVEESWTRVMRRYPHLDAAQYTVNGTRLHALVQVQAPEASAETDLRTALAAYQEATEAAWSGYRTESKVKQPAQLWEETIEVRRVRDRDELQSLREFIVQKMLGGELSDPDSFDEDDWL